MQFDSRLYGTEIAQILDLDQGGYRLIPLVSGNCSPVEARTRIEGRTTGKLFPKAQYPALAVAALWLYFSCLDECHDIVQNLNSPEACLWHAILHRQEPDSGNAAYWFRRAGAHPTFRELTSMADEVLQRYPQAEFRTGGKWDPFAFVMFCERARQQPGSDQERAAVEIQRAEWQILFDHCARPQP